jgi:hypothetical protein
MLTGQSGNGHKSPIKSTFFNASFVRITKLPCSMCSGLEPIRISPPGGLMTDEFRRFNDQVLDDLFLAATNSPVAVRAIVRIEKTDEPGGVVERSFFVDAGTMTLLHDLLHALEDRGLG